MINAVGSSFPAFPAAARSLPAATEAGGFGQVMSDVVRQAAGTLREAEASAAAAIQGRIDTREAVSQVLAAERTLQAVIAVRDKAVGAYLEISRMQI